MIKSTEYSLRENDVITYLLFRVVIGKGKKCLKICLLEAKILSLFNDFSIGK